MKKGSILSLYVIAFAAIMLIGTHAFAAHPTVDGGGNPISVVLKNASGGTIAPGTTTPYSPKQTCGVCHNYESDPMTTVTKQQTVSGTANAAYNVPVPEHGVTAGYHFQQGMNLPWGNTQRSYYGLPSFTSSPGMYGKF